jgi:hypothetical protein
MGNGDGSSREPIKMGSILSPTPVSMMRRRIQYRAISTTLQDPACKKRGSSKYCVLKKSRLVRGRIKGTRSLGVDTRSELV